jgi:WD40 repeat protein
MRTAHLLALAGALSAQTWTGDIRPLLHKRCAACHTGGAKLGEFECNTFEQLMKGGNHGRPVAPGSSADSLLYQMITGKANPTMPMDGTFLSTGEIELVRKWIDSGAKGPDAPESATAASAAAPTIKPRVAPKPQIFAAAVHGNLAAVGAFKEVRLVALPGKSTAGTLPGHAGPVRNVAFSRDGRLLAAAGGVCAKKGEVKIWDVEKRAVAQTIVGHDDCVYGLAFSPDGATLATSSYDKLIKLWDVASGRELRTLKDHIDSVYALDFTPDGKRLVSGAADRTVKVWDPATGKRLYTFSESTDGVNSVAVDPTGKRVAAGGIDKSIRVWTLGDTGGELVHSLMAHEDAILKVVWTPDGKQIVSSSADKSVKVLSAADLSEVKILPGQSDWTYGLQPTPDGRNLFLGRMDGSIDLLAMR